MPGVEQDNFGFENPNYNKLSQADRTNQYHRRLDPQESSRNDLQKTRLVDGDVIITSEAYEKELNNSVDLFYERNDTVWSDNGATPDQDHDYDNYVTSSAVTRKVYENYDSNKENGARIKNRTHYARIGIGDMGVPNSPSVDDDDDDRSSLSRSLNRSAAEDYSPLSSAGGGQRKDGDSDEEEIVEEIHDVWYKHTKENRYVNQSGDILIPPDDYSDRPSSNDRSGPNRRIYVPYGGNRRKQQDKSHRFRHYRSLDNLSIDVNQDGGGQTSTATMYTNGTYPHQYSQRQRTSHYVDDASVDYSSHDFRRSFAAIDQASRERSTVAGSSAQYPSGGLRMRKEQDGVTVLTEHRDPYSFYWQLDKARRTEEPPKRDEIVSENVIEEIAVEESTQVQSPDSHDSGIHVEYSRPSKPVKPIIERFTQSRSDASPKRKLPPGWERHEDPSGFSYYWHVDSGTVQREPPKETPKVRRATIEEVEPLYVPKVMTLVQSPKPKPVTAVIKVHHSMSDRRVHVEQERSVNIGKSYSPLSQAVQTAPSAQVAQPQQSIIIERAFKQTTTKRRIENDTSDDRDETAEDGSPKTPVRFAVRSLGWTEIAEEDLTPERSSRAVNKAIVDLSIGRNDLIDNVSKWGDGKELIMELDDHDLRLIDPDSGTLLHTQPIHQIRVWGVGRDNGRDFAYVARDRNTRRFMCHVFRCDTPARTIANTLRDICRRLMTERRPASLQTSGLNGGRESRQSTTAGGSRPDSRYGVEQVDTNATRRSVARDPFPTPIEEPKKVIRCHFLGVTQVPRATGIEILNEAVDRLVAQVRTERWILVDVSIAPSTITVTEVGGNQIAECRVRYLSFLGIGRDVKHCAFIMHTSADNFMCYVFHVEPSAGAMAKTIEAACKLRYQKVLDSHSERRTNGSKGFSDAIRNVFGSIAGRRPSRTSQPYPS